jgi:hypothetical protein
VKNRETKFKAKKSEKSAKSEKIDLNFWPRPMKSSPSNSLYKEEVDTPWVGLRDIFSFVLEYGWGRETKTIKESEELYRHSGGNVLDNETK